MWKNKLPKILLLAESIILIILVIVLLVKFNSDSSEQQNVVDSSYSINEKGLSYGPQKPDQELPDLLLVEYDGDKEGYVYTYELNNSSSSEISVYKSDGITEIGVFHIDKRS